ncbi:hypothetical protein IPC297_26570 [Pseudomonas aeruginosa]|nr:hypothetical protein IPC297_26570 [Pseudomonas aeruginosa]
MLDLATAYQHLLHSSRARDVLTPEELSVLATAVRLAVPDRGGRLVVQVSSLPERVSATIEAWGRVSPDALLDEVDEAIQELCRGDQDS